MIERSEEKDRDTLNVAPGGSLFRHTTEYSRRVYKFSLNSRKASG